MNMNLLFYGPSGSGKSELARYIAEKLDREIICKRVSDI
jgi:adenylate kinase family enzyme